MRLARSCEKKRERDRCKIRKGGSKFGGMRRKSESGGEREGEEEDRGENGYSRAGWRRGKGRGKGGGVGGRGEGGRGGGEREGGRETGKHILIKAIVIKSLWRNRILYSGFFVVFVHLGRKNVNLYQKTFRS